MTGLDPVIQGGNGDLRARNSWMAASRAAME